MAKAMSRKTAETIEKSGIRIERGPVPELLQRAKPPSRLDEAYQMIKVMPDGSWFIVPGTEGRVMKQCMGTIGAISRFCKANGITGVFARPAADGGGLVVRKVADGVSE